MSEAEGQELALAALRGGRTFGRAAQEAGVSRMTLYRWLRGHPHFRPAFNAWQQEAADSAQTSGETNRETANSCLAQWRVRQNAKSGRLLYL